MNSEAHEARIRYLEDWKHEKDIELTGQKKDFEHISRRLDKIESGINRILWIVGGGILMAIVTFLLNGGLTS